MSEKIAVNITIASGASKSAAQDLGGRALVGIITPAALDGDKFVFEGSVDGSTFVPIYTDAASPARVDLAIGTSRLTGLGSKAVYFEGVRHLKIETQTAGEAQNQSALRTITLLLQ